MKKPYISAGHHDETVSWMLKNKYDLSWRCSLKLWKRSWWYRVATFVAQVCFLFWYASPSNFLGTQYPVPEPVPNKTGGSLAALLLIFVLCKVARSFPPNICTVQPVCNSACAKLKWTPEAVSRLGIQFWGRVNLRSISLTQWVNHLACYPPCTVYSPTTCHHAPLLTTAKCPSVHDGKTVWRPKFRSHSLQPAQYSAWTSNWTEEGRQLYVCQLHLWDCVEALLLWEDSGNPCT